MKLPVWGTILTVIGVVVLCTLGTWQLDRLAWKKDLIAKLDAAYASNQAGALDLKTDFSMFASIPKYHSGNFTA